MNFATNLKKIRTNLGLTQAQLGTKLGVGYQVILRWEKGYRIPKIDKIKDIAEALNTTEAILLADNDETTTKAN